MAEMLTAFCSTTATPVEALALKSRTFGFSQTAKLVLNTSLSAPSTQRVMGVQFGLPLLVRYSAARIMPSLRSPADAPLPIQTKSSVPASMMNTSLVSSWSLTSWPLAFLSCLLNSTVPVASLTLNSSVAALALASAALSSSPLLVTSILPPRASQNSAFSGSSSRKKISPLAPRSSRSFWIISKPLDFSERLASLPLYRKNFWPRSRMNTSPVLSEAASCLTVLQRTMRLPLRCSRRAS